MLVDTKILSQWTTVACDIAPACSRIQSVGPVNLSLHSLIHLGLVDESSIQEGWHYRFLLDGSMRRKHADRRVCKLFALAIFCLIRWKRAESGYLSYSSRYFLIRMFGLFERQKRQAGS